MSNRLHDDNVLAAEMAADLAIGNGIIRHDCIAPGKLMFHSPASGAMMDIGDLVDEVVKLKARVAALEEELGSRSTLRGAVKAVMQEADRE